MEQLKSLTKVEYTFKEQVMMFLGFRYVLNDNTQEIHDLRNKTKNCCLPAMKRKHKFYVGRAMANEHLDMGYNGCRFCYKEEDNG